MVVTYFLPMLSMSVTYAKIGAELWGARAIGEATAVQRESINSKRRVSNESTTLRFFKEIPAKSLRNSETHSERSAAAIKVLGFPFSLSVE